MSARVHHFRVGLFVLAGGVLLVGALFAVGLKAYFGTRDIFETYVAGKVENLSVGALVKLRGVTIGQISAIDFIGSEYPGYGEQYVLIQFEVPRGTVWTAETNNVQELLDAEVGQGLRARVQAQGFFGASILALDYVDPTQYPVQSVPWTPKHYYIPSAPSQLNGVLTALEKSLRHVEALDFAGVLTNANRLIDQVDGVAGKVREIDFGQLGTNANSLIVEFRQSAIDFQRTLSDAQKAINGADLPAVSKDAAGLADKLSRAALEFRRVLASMDSEELKSSIANIRATTEELNALIGKLEARPSAVLFSRSPDPVPEMEKPSSR